MMQLPPITAFDLFCGAGGTSAGIIRAVTERLRRQIILTAINHWRTAINTHSLNYPFVRHLCESVENLHPLDLVEQAYLDLLAASCECRYHSNARGGGPCNEQSRSQAWQIIRWATDITVENILMENVREFMNWGPLLTRPITYRGRRYKKDRPDPRRKGEFFRAFISTLGNLGYTVEYRVQCAADYGDATRRERFILMARKGKPITWPEPTHGPGRRQPHRPARDIIDWSLRGRSALLPDGTPRHCPNTMERIIKGLKKFGGPAAEPFIVMLNGSTAGHINASSKSINEPLPTVVAGGNHAMLCEPFVIHLTHHGSDENRIHSLDDPLPTVTAAHRGEMSLVQPIIIQTDQTGGNGLYARTVDEPLPTVVSKQNMMLVQPLVMKYYKTGRCKPLDVPLDTVTTKPRFLLVECEQGRFGYDVLTRLLEPHELAASHSFPRTFKLTGNKEDQTTQVGNSVPIELATAHAEAVLS